SRASLVASIQRSTISARLAAAYALGKAASPMQTAGYTHMADIRSREGGDDHAPVLALFWSSFRTAPDGHRWNRRRSGSCPRRPGGGDRGADASCGHAQGALVRCLGLAERARTLGG